MGNADELLKLKELLDAGAITQQDYDRKKAELLGLAPEPAHKRPGKGAIIAISVAAAAIVLAVGIAAACGAFSPKQEGQPAQQAQSPQQAGASADANEATKLKDEDAGQDKFIGSWKLVDYTVVGIGGADVEPMQLDIREDGTATWSTEGKGSADLTWTKVSGKCVLVFEGSKETIKYSCATDELDDDTLVLEFVQSDGTTFYFQRI